MVATFTPDGGSPVTLAGSDSSGCFDQPSGIQMWGDTVVQGENIVRAEAPARYDRKNYTRGLRFRVEKSYSTWDDAVAGNAAMLDSVKGIGVFTLTSGVTTLLTINNAKVSMQLGDGGSFASREFTVEGTA